MHTHAIGSTPPTRRRLMLGVIAAAALATPCRAERALVPLGRLFSESQHVVLGTVAAVTDHGLATEVATVHVEHVVTGPGGLPGSEIEVRGTPLDPEGYGFDPGDRVALFLRDPITSTSTVFRPTDDAGVFGLPPGDLTPVITLLSAARDHGGRPPLAVILPYLQSGGPTVSLGLLAAALAQLALVADPADAASGAGLAAIACGDTAAAHASVREWALAHAGRVGVAAARPCLEALVTVPKRRRRTPQPPGARALQLAAVDGLVHFDDFRSVDVLEQSLLSQAGYFGSCDSIDLIVSTIHGLGSLSSEEHPVRSRTIGKTALKSPSTVVASTAVYVLGRIGDAHAQALLRRIARRHPVPLIQAQALETLARIGG